MEIKGAPSRVLTGRNMRSLFVRVDVGCSCVQKGGEYEANERMKARCLPSRISKEVTLRNQRQAALYNTHHAFLRQRRIITSTNLDTTLLRAYHAAKHYLNSTMVGRGIELLPATCPFVTVLSMWIDQQSAYRYRLETDVIECPTTCGRLRSWVCIVRLGHAALDITTYSWKHSGLSQHPRELNYE